MPLTYVERIPFVYPTGQQDLHANFHADPTGIYFASRGKVFAYEPNGDRLASSDIILQNHPNTANDRIWGFTKTSDGNWATLTRDAGTGIIGTIRLYSPTGTQMRVANVPDVVTGINTVSNAWRAPKALVEVSGFFYVRVVRDVSGNMRWVKFDSTLDVQDDDLIINNANPTSLSDAASNGYQNILIVQHNQDIVYGIKASDATIVSNLQTDLEARNTDPFGASAYGNYLYIADLGGFVYTYSGVPQRVISASNADGGAILTAFGLYSLNAFAAREFNQPRRRF